MSTYIIKLAPTVMEMFHLLSNSNKSHLYKKFATVNLVSPLRKNIFLSFQIN